MLSKDPNAKRKGFGNAAGMITQMWEDFANRGDEFVNEAATAYHHALSGALFSDPILDIEYESKEGRNVPTFTARRLNQDYFRKSLLDLYDYRCCVTGLEVESLLVASHIKPWSESDPLTERVNAENGLLLNTLHDRAFDKGLISVSDDYEILISAELRKMCESDTSGVLKWICSPKRGRINPPQKHSPNPEFLEYHRDVVFKG